MMGLHEKQKDLFSYSVNLDKRVRSHNPLRAGLISGKKLHTETTSGDVEENAKLPAHSPEFFRP